MDFPDKWCDIHLGHLIIKVRVVRSVAPKSFSPPASVLDKSKACFRRLQNSPAAQTVVIADPTLRQDLFVKLQFRKRSALELAS
jgi:hypothetical protein